jgi:hypothetical protein
MIKNTVWESAKMKLGFCLLSNLAPIPFGATIIEEFTSTNGFIKNMNEIPQIHGKWATLIIKCITQAKSHNYNTTVYKTITETRSTGDWDCPARHGARKGGPKNNAY